MHTVCTWRSQTASKIYLHSNRAERASSDPAGPANAALGLVLDLLELPLVRQYTVAGLTLDSSDKRLSNVKFLCCLGLASLFCLCRLVSLVSSSVLSLSCRVLSCPVLCSTHLIIVVLWKEPVQLTAVGDRPKRASSIHTPQRPTSKALFHLGI